MRRFNRAYGHRATLWNFAGLDDRPTFSFLQHGWSVAPDAGNGDFAASQHLPQAPRIFWSRRQQREAQSLGIPNAVAAGAPFLYLLGMSRPFASDSHHERSRPNSRGARRVLFYPRHNWEMSSHIDPLRCLPAIRGAVEAGDHVFVSLHPVEAKDPRVRLILGNLGVTIVSNGSGRYDPSFLIRQLGILHSVDEVVSDGIGTAALYAASAGVRVTFVGRDTPFDDRHDRPSSQDFFGREDVHDVMSGHSTFADFALAELGADLLLTPSEVGVLLGRSISRRSAATALRVSAEARSIVRANLLGDETAAI